MGPKMINYNPDKIIAQAVRIEQDTFKHEVYLVFQIIDEEFKQDVLKNWTQDLDLKLLGKNLVNK